MQKVKLHVSDKSGSCTDTLQSTLDESFLLNAIQLLAKAILNPELMSDSFSNHHELMIASALVSVLLEFLKGKDSFIYNSL